MELPELAYGKLGGLVPVVIQEVNTKDVLMVAFADEAAVKQSLDTRVSTFYSRSRSGLWVKGEISGNFQEIEKGYVDCDTDTLLYKVRQQGNDGACHLPDRYSCFDNGQIL